MDHCCTRAALLLAVAVILLASDNTSAWVSSSLGLQRQISQQRFFVDRNLLLLSQQWLYPTVFRRTLLGAQRGDDEEEEEIFFDDFGGQEIGQMPSSPMSSAEQKLQERIQIVQTQELQEGNRVQENWNMGNWQVRGFSLDPESVSDDDDKVVVCSIVPAANEELDEMDDSIWVGRSDGSVVKVATMDTTEYWTRFRNQLTAEPSASNPDAVSVQRQLVREKLQEPPIGTTSETDNDDTTMQAPPSQPFEIQQQFRTTRKAPISYMLAHQSYLFTANKDSSNITQWLLPDDDDQKPVVFAVLTGVHLSTAEILGVFSVTLLSDDNKDVLVSVASDGSLGLWDIAAGAPRVQHQVRLDDEPVHIASADMNQNILFLGTATGDVLAYRVDDLLSAASPVMPNGRWSASHHAVTALLAMPTSTPQSTTTTTCRIVTGDAQGVLKQWQLLPRGPDRLEHWPKLSTQRLPQAAHVFHTRPHHDDDDASIAALAVVATTQRQVVSASSDGCIGVWDTNTGAQVFSMHGFTGDIRSLVVLNGVLLVTDGMNEYVSVHDFSNVEELVEESDNEYLDEL